MLRTGWLVLLLVSLLMAQSNDWQTFYEKSNFKRTPRYAETIAFIEKLAQASPWVDYQTFGKSPQGRDLPLVILDKDGHFTPEAVRQSDKVVVLVLSGIHAGEIDGKDASLMLLRDIAIYRKMTNLLDHVTVLFVPIFNVDGHERFGPYNRINQNGPAEMGWRVTAQNLNLNRDFLKADAPEMQAFLHLFQRWLPDLLIDCHVTDGADYQYVVTYGLDKSPQVTPALRRWTKTVFEPLLVEGMEQAGILTTEYFWIRDRKDPTRGLFRGVLSPRFSTGYGAVQNRIFLLIETHMLKPYRQRVNATYHMIQRVLEIANDRYFELQKVNFEADTESRQLAGQFLPLTFRIDTRDTTWMEFRGKAVELDSSEISGTTWVKFLREPRTYHAPVFQKPLVQDSARVPEAYLIPPQWQLPLERLRLHGVHMAYLREPITLTVDSYRFQDVKWQQNSYEGHHRVSYRIIPVTEERTFPRGTVVIFMNQRVNRVIVHALEPAAPDAFVAWGMWDTIFERKEYAENYKLEILARQMLKQNPQLRQEFWKRVQSDSAFAHNPRERLQFFYERSPYWDAQYNRYPVGKLYTIPQKLKKILTAQNPLRD